MSRLYVALENPRCKAGSTISGTVELRGDDDINVVSITISLIGRCKTRIVRDMGDSAETLRGRAPLITERRILFNGPNTLHPGHSWSFQFSLPYHCVERGQDLFTSTPVSMVGTFNSDINQPLPPAFFASTNTAVAFVSYELVANLAVGRRAPLGTKDIPTTKVLDFLTTRTVQNPDPRMSLLTRSFDCSSLALNPGHENVPLTFKQRLKSFHKTNLPMARFKIKLIYPQVAVVDRTLALKLSVDHDFENSTAVAPPMIYLRKFSLDLVASTATQYVFPSRSPRPSASEQIAGKQTWEVKYPIGAFERVKKGNPSAPPVSESLDLKDWINLRVSRRHAPTFTTFNIRRTYKLSAKMTIECAQQQYKAEFLTDSLLLLPATYEAAVTNGVNESAGNELQIDEPPDFTGLHVDDSLPPAYAPRENGTVPLN